MILGSAREGLGGPVPDLKVHNFTKIIQDKMSKKHVKNAQLKCNSTLSCTQIGNVKTFAFFENFFCCH